MSRPVQKRRDGDEAERDDKKRADPEQHANREARLVVAREIQIGVRPLAIKGPEPVRRETAHERPPCFLTQTWSDAHKRTRRNSRLGHQGSIKFRDAFPAPLGEG